MLAPLSHSAPGCGWWDHRGYVLRRLRRAVAELLDAALPPAAGANVVDLGCGETPYADLVLQRGAVYVGCDLAGAAVTLVPSQRVQLPDAAADVVLSTQVLEHVADVPWYLDECRRLLKPAGALVLSTHGQWPYHPHPQDFRRWTRTGLIAELAQHGLAVAQTRAIVGPLAYATLVRHLAVRHVLHKVPMVGPLTARLLVPVMNVQMWLEDLVVPGAVLQDNAAVYAVLARPIVGPAVTTGDAAEYA